MIFFDITYLKNGTTKQKKIFQILTFHSFFKLLNPFNPCLVGSIPLGIDIETSDVDIICCSDDPKFFFLTCVKISALFSDIRYKMYKDNFNTQTFSFFLEGLQFEIFCQNQKVEEQMAYKHLKIEHKILQNRDENFKISIIDLKINGFKTEFAFAKLLNIKGDPYQELLKLDLQ